MRHVIKLPNVADSVDTVVLLQWHVAIGDCVEPGTTLATVETDKVEVEVPSPLAGTVIELSVVVEEEVSVGEKLCVLEG